MERKMKKTGILNQPISNLIAGLGHYDMVVIDAGLPIPPGVLRIDLALVPGLPGFIDTVKAVLLEMEVGEVIVARETGERSPQILAGLQECLGQKSFRVISHEEFKEASQHAAAVIRTGECTPYANVILCSGVIF
jgi:D-ribose pyranase